MSYFATEGVQRSGDGRFAALADLPEVDVGGGVILRPFAGTSVMISHATLEAGGEAPAHVHHEEQMGIVLTGRCVFSLDGVERELVPGDVYHAPPGVAHGVVAGPDGCVIVDVFSPPRAALLERMMG